MDVSDILMLSGELLLLTWLIWVYKKQRQRRNAVKKQTQEVIVMGLNEEAMEENSNTTTNREDTMIKPKTEQLNAKEVKRQLDRYEGNESLLQKYVVALSDRFTSKIVTNVLQEWAREADARIVLVEKIIQGIEAEGRLHRVEEEEKIKDIDLETRQAEAEARRKEAQEQGRSELDQAARDADIAEHKARKAEAEKRIREATPSPPRPPEPQPEPRPYAEILTEVNAKIEPILQNQRKSILGYETANLSEWRKKLREEDPEYAEDKIAEYEQFEKTTREALMEDAKKRGRR